MAAKVFEVNDVLPATTQLRIIADIPNAGWDTLGGAYTTNEYLRVYVYDDCGGADYDFEVKVNGSFLTLSNYNLSKLVNNEWVSCEYVEYSIMSVIIDTSTWTETQRTIVSATHPIYWEDLNAPPGYTITFEENGGTTIPDIEEATELPDPLPIPTKSGYTFVNWYYDSAFTQIANPGDTIESNVTLYAKWEEISLGYTITFDSNGGSIVPQTSNATQLPDPLPITTKPGYTFVAWYIDSALTTRAVAGATIEEDTTLYAKWHTLGSLFTEIADAIRSKDGTSESIRDVDFGERVNALPSPKEEETKTVTPDFSSGNQIILPTTNKVLSKVTLTKPTDLIPENIAKDKNVCGVVGTSFIAIELTQAQYDALATKDANTYYLIKG